MMSLGGYSWTSRALLLAIAFPLLVGCGRGPNIANLIRLQLNAKKSAATEQDLLRAIEVDPKSIPARLALANFYLQQKRWAEAEQQFREAIQIEPKDPSPYAALASLLQNEGKH